MKRGEMKWMLLIFIPSIRKTRLFLVDQWWRGTDSKGPLQTGQIIGLVKGYAQ
jgi:hypothetical protein